jgi:hypothetical protein
MKYKVRSEFYVHLNELVFGPGEEIELDDASYQLVAHQVEPVVAAKLARKVKADGDQ